MPPTALAIAMARLAEPASRTVPTDSSPPAPSVACSARACPGAGAGCVMPGAVPRGTRRHAKCGERGFLAPRTRSADADQVDDEDEGLPRLDDTAGAAVAVGLVRRDGQPAAATDPHRGN